ncbi:MAG: PAS domain S-box protein [Blastocatellia bacterium]
MNGQTDRLQAGVSGGHLKNGGGLYPTIATGITDVTIRESEERFRTLAETASDVILTVNESGEIVFANSATASVFGYAAEEIIGQNMAVLIPESSRSQHIKSLASYIETGQRQISWKSIQWQGLHKDGHEVPIELSLGEFFSNGRRYFTGIIRDITNRKRREALIAGQVQIFEMIATGRELTVVLDRIARLIEDVAGNLRCVIFQLDSEGDYLSIKAAPGMSKEFCEALQALPVGIRNGTCGACITEKEPQISADITCDSRWADFLEFALSYGIRASWSTPVFDANRNPLGTIAILYQKKHVPELHEMEFVQVASHLASIAIEHHRAEEKQRKSEARFRALIEKSQDGISLTDQFGALVYASSASYRILGYEPEEVLGKKSQHLVDSDDWPMLSKLANDLIGKPGDSDSARYRARHKNGHWIWIEATLTNLLHEPSVQALVVNFRDITQNKLAEDALRASEERYRTLVAALDEGIILMDQNAVMLAANASAERILGLTAEQIKNRTLFNPQWEVVHEDGSPFTPETFPAAITLITGTPCSNTVMGVRKPSGQIVWLSINTRPLIREAETKPYAVVISFADVTERVRTQAELRDSEERFSTAFKSSPCPMSLLTFPEGRFVDINNAWQQTYGYSLDEVVGRTSAEMKLWQNVQQREEMYGQLITKGAVRNFEVVGLTKNSAPVTYLLSAEIIEFGGKKHILSSCYDITESKRAEQALRESEEHYRLLFEHSFTGIARMRVDGEMIEANEAMAHMFGCSSPKELLEAKDSNFYFDLEERQRLIEEVVAQGSLRNREIKLKRLDGSTIWALINTSLFQPNQDSEPTLEGIVLDITERKLTEQKLEQLYEQSRAHSARLEAVREEERGRIAREVHDNLGQLMTGLKLDFSWLEKRMARIKQESLRQEIEPKLVEIADLLEGAILTVRDIATDLRPGVLDTLGLRAAIDWLTREFERKNGVKCVSKLCQDPKNLSPELATALFRILQELLTNITRHAKAQIVKVELTKVDSEIRLTVADDGVGITEAQLQNTRSLGLLGMRERTAIFGGDVMIEGKPGLGTTVKVRMPLK